MAWPHGGPGRPPGVSKRTTARYSEAREFAAAVVDDPQYRANVIARALAGTLPPALEAVLWYYRFGKPAEDIKVDVKTDDAHLADLSDEQLAARAEQIASALRTKHHEDRDEDDAPRVPINPTPGAIH